MAYNQIDPTSFSEVFCSELPSQCNLYLSGKRASRLVRRCHQDDHPSKRQDCNPRKRSSASSFPVLRFATECHSLKFMQKHSKGERHAVDYSLSEAQLPAPKSLVEPKKEEHTTLLEGSKKSKKETSPATHKGALNEEGEETTDTAICLAHSSISWTTNNNLLLKKAYQVNFEVTNCGKTVSTRRIQFKFGYIHDYEHELIVAWSFSSGAQSITLDGKVVYCNEDDAPPTNTKLQYTLRDQDAGHTLEVTAHASPVDFKLESDPDWRQCDLLIDGTSFFQLPNISEISESDRKPRYKHHESTLEVFAMTRDHRVENDAKDQKLTDNASLTTHGSHSISEGVGDAIEQKSADAGGAPATLNNEAGGKNDHVASPNHYLIVKRKVLRVQSPPQKEDVAPKMYSAVETIQLDFRPMSVHATELYVTKNDTQSESTSAVGIFVTSVDDNKLRLFVATKEILRSKRADIKTGQCFSLVSLADASLSELQGNDAFEGSTSNPLIFSTPIMAMDTAVTDRHNLPTAGDKGKSDVKLNRLALACYDGTVRILTYQLKESQQTEDDSSGLRLQFCHQNCSAFIVDGPVVSLHFGEANIPEGQQIQHSNVPEKTQLQQRPQSSFLVAGSLCGFACIFYEEVTPDGSLKTDSAAFDGPLALVDGLYDARQEGYEDSVTAVHVCQGSRDRVLIVVGTQGGRVLLFQQHPNESEKNIQNNADSLSIQENNDELVCQIEEDEKELSRLQSEREDMERKARDLLGAIKEYKSIIGSLTAKVSPEPNSLGTKLDPVLEKSETSSNSSNLEDDEQILDSLTMSHIKEEETEPGWTIVGEEKEEVIDDNASATTDTATVMTTDEEAILQTKLKTAQMELSSLEQQTAHTKGEMAELRSAVDSSKNRTKEGNDSVCTRTGSQRKMHRYKFVWEYHLPYPIHGIASSAGGQQLFVSTRRSFHVFSNYSSTDFDDTVVNGTIALVEERLSKMLAS